MKLIGGEIKQTNTSTHISVNIKYNIVHNYLYFNQTFWLESAIKKEKCAQYAYVCVILIHTVFKSLCIR